MGQCINCGKACGTGNFCNSKCEQEMTEYLEREAEQDAHLARQSHRTPSDEVDEYGESIWL